jgi:hypothetical protein
MIYTLYIYICEHFIKEAVNLIRQEDIKIVPYKNECKICSPEFTNELNELLNSGVNPKAIHVIGGRCLNNINIKNIETTIFEQCFYMVTNRGIVDDYLKKGCYLITPGWLENWEKHMTDMGFYGKNAEDFFHEFTSKLVLFDTEIMKKSKEKMEEIGKFLNLPFEILPVGLDYINMILREIILKWNFEKQKEKNTTGISQAHRRLSDYIMAMDLICQIYMLESEEDIIDKIFELFTSLFAPKELIYIKMKNDEPVRIYAVPEHLAKDGDRINLLKVLQRDYSFTGSGRGFRVRIKDKETCLGLLEVENVMMTQYLNHYASLALNIVPVLSARISNFRNY